MKERQRPKFLMEGIYIRYQEYGKMLILLKLGGRVSIMLDVHVIGHSLSAQLPVKTRNPK